MLSKIKKLFAQKNNQVRKLVPRKNVSGRVVATNSASLVSNYSAENAILTAQQLVSDLVLLPGSVEVGCPLKRATKSSSRIENFSARSHHANDSEKIIDSSCSHREIAISSHSDHYSSHESHQSSSSYDSGSDGSSSSGD